MSPHNKDGVASNSSDGVRTRALPKASDGVASNSSDKNGIGIGENGIDQNGIDQNGIDENGIDQNGIESVASNSSDDSSSELVRKERRLQKRMRKVKLRNGQALVKVHCAGLQIVKKRCKELQEKMDALKEKEKSFRKRQRVLEKEKPMPWQEQHAWTAFHADKQQLHAGWLVKGTSWRKPNNPLKNNK